MLNYDEVVNQLKEAMDEITVTLSKVYNKPHGWKKASAIARKQSVALTKLFKDFRSVSVAECKITKTKD